MERFQQRFLSKRWQKVLLILSGIVVFVTTYALILPAITIDTDTAEREPGIVIETSAEAEFPAVNLENEAASFTVKVDAESGVFPADTVLVVNEAEETPEMRSAIQEAVSAKVTDFRAVDVAFENAEGEAVSPQDNYLLTLNSSLITADKDQAVVAISGEGDVQVIDESALSNKQVAFEADAGLTVAVVRTEELTAEYLSADGALYEVTVTYDHTANIPEGSRLAITEFEPGSPEYEAVREAVLLSSDFEPVTPTVIQKDGGLILRDGASAEADAADADMGLDAFDLTIYGPEGAPVEPASAVQVRIRRKALPDENKDAEEYGDVSVMHLNESGDAPFVENMQPEVLITEDGIAADFETESFSTYTLSWRFNSNGTRYRTSTIHYGYMNGNNFVEFPNGTITQDINISTSASPAFLIYDAPGYEFSSAHLNSPTGTAIEPLIRYSNNRWQYTPDGTTSWANIANSNATTANQDIYMVYQAKQPVIEGGEAKLYEYGADDTPPAPTAEKNSVNNHDGTRTISLSISGGATPIEVEKLADVIVVFDVSGSMGRYINSESNADNYEDSRLYHTKEAAKALADELLNGAQYFNRDGEHLVRMSLIKFSNIAEQVNSGFEFGNFTENYATFAAAIDGMSANGGTNWEHSLQLANEISDLDPDRATFVIFITDGNPTFRMTRSPDGAMTDANLRSDDLFTGTTYQYYRQNNVFGKGDSDNLGNNYAAALAQVESILSHNKLFYSIGVSNAVTNLEQLTTEAHANVGKDGTDHSFSVTDEEELYDAFNEIRAAIAATLGWTNVDIDDGITEETELSAKVPVADLAGTADFEYYVTKNGVTTQWTLPSNCQPAAYNQNSGCVEWHMGSNFQLEQGVTYTVQFKVWPSQQALDYVTQIQNGVITYNELPDTVKQQIVLDPATGVYTLKTNKDPMTFSYELSKKTGDTVVVDHSLSGEGQITVINSDPLVLDSMIMRIDKQWLDFLTNAEDRMDEVTLYLQRRLHDDANGPDDGWEDFEVFHRNADGVWETSNRFVFNETNEWSISFFITPGLIDAENEALDPGYEYRVQEPGIDYHYELDAENIRPMFFGYETVTEGNKENLEQKDVYIVEEYLDDTDGSHSLSAINKVKGGIHITKHLLDAAGSEITNDDTVFTIKGYILDPNGNPYTFDPAWDDREDRSKGIPESEQANYVWYGHQNDPIAFHTYDSAGNRTGYKLHAASTDDITLELKAGESVRFVNVPRNCTYAFWEVSGDLPAGYQWVSITGENHTRDANNNYTFYTPQPYPENTGTTPAGDTWLGGKVFSDVQHNIDITNRMLQPNHISVTKKVTKADGETQVWPNESFTFHGGIWNWRGTPYTFDPAWDDRTDRSQGIPEAEYGSYTWDDHQNDPIAYNILDKDGNYVVYKGHFDSTDEISFTLKSGETIEFLDVPTASTYRFWEITDDMDAPDSIYQFVSAEGSAVNASGDEAQQPSVWENEDGYTVVSGTVDEGDDHAVTVKNKFRRDPVPLRLVKTDAEDETVKLNGVTFRLYTDASHETPALDYEGVEIGPITTGGYADEAQTVPLGAAEIGSLWPGTYYLVETDPPPGYKPLTDHIVITVSSDGAVTVTNPDFAAATGSGFVTEQDGLITVAVPNLSSSGTELPSTGGRGTLLYTLGGITLMLLAVLVYIFSLRRRKGVRVNS